MHSRALLRRESRAAVHERDGYEALVALVPPREARAGLIDPPYEAPDEYERLERTLVAAIARWPLGIYASGTRSSTATSPAGSWLDGRDRHPPPARRRTAPWSATTCPAA